MAPGRERTQKAGVSGTAIPCKEELSKWTDEQSLPREPPEGAASAPPPEEVQSRLDGGGGASVSTR